WSPDTVHLYMGGCNINYLFDKYAERLICMDFIDAKYEFQRQEMRLPNGKVEKAGSQNGTFMLSNKGLDDGEVVCPHLLRELKGVNYKGGVIVDDDAAPLGRRDNFPRAMRYIREKLQPIYA